MATYDAGIVTAYGAAVRGGYTGTYEDFCAQQANYASTAAVVAQAKADAEAAATAAQTAAASLTVDSAMSNSSTNPVQNKVIYEELSDLKDGLDAMSTATVSDVGKALKVKTVASGKVTEWEFGETGNGKLPADFIEALQTILYAGVYTTDQSDNIDDLSNFEYQPELNNITAIYSGGYVLVGTNANTLAYSVTATYDDGTTKSVDDYTVESLIIAKGNNTVTIAYGGLTTTVVVVGYSDQPELPPEYTQVAWLYNYVTATAYPVFPLNLFNGDVLEFQFDKVSSGGGGSLFNSDYSNTRIAFYNNGVYSDLNNSRAGFASLADGVNTITVGNNYVTVEETQSTKTGITQSAVQDEVKYCLYTGQAQSQAQHVKYLKKFNSNNVLVAHLLPVTCSTDNSTGFYDWLNEVYYKSPSVCEVGDPV